LTGLAGAILTTRILDGVHAQEAYAFEIGALPA
jgi:hypothetical protein